MNLWGFGITKCGATTEKAFCFIHIISTSDKGGEIQILTDVPDQSNLCCFHSKTR